MSSLLSAIRDDKVEYFHLCKKHGEEPIKQKDVYLSGADGVDPYCEHAKLLKRYDKLKSKIIKLIADDSYASSFQTIGQYRSQLIKNINRVNE